MRHLHFRKKQIFYFNEAKKDANLLKLLLDVGSDCLLWHDLSCAISPMRTLKLVPQTFLQCASELFTTYVLINCYRDAIRTTCCLLYSLSYTLNIIYGLEDIPIAGRTLSGRLTNKSSGILTA